MVYIQEELSADAPRRVLLDPNALSTDGTVALGRTSFSDDGTLMAYTLSKAGSDWTEIHVMRLLPPSSGAAEPQVAEKLADHLTFVKFSSLSWTKDGKGFFYNRYPKLEGREDLGTEMNASENQELMYHVLGTDQVRRSTTTTQDLAMRSDPAEVAQDLIEGIYMCMGIGSLQGRLCYGFSSVRHLIWTK